jgi:signal peptidase I
MGALVWKWCKEWIPSLIVAGIISLLLQTYVAQAVKVPTPSMEPTIHVDDRLIMEKLERVDHYEFGDIVVFWPPVQTGPEKERYVKRLIGLPGDSIEIREGVLYRNGVRVEEPYLNERMTYRFGPVVVPEGKYVFLGDNRNHSFDSHLWPTPFVDQDDIIGRVILRYYPLDQISGM